MKLETQFACSDGGEFCWRMNVNLQMSRRGSSADLGIEITHVWFIRDRFTLNPGFVEQDALDILAGRHIDAMWVDSESDARAMAAEA